MDTDPFIDKLMRALQGVIEATREHDKAEEGFEGYSWDYYGGNFIEKKKKAQLAFKQTLESYIDARIQLVLSKLD